MGWSGVALRQRLPALCLAVVMLTACGSGPVGAGDRAGGDTRGEASAALAWAGFTDIAGLELVDASGEAGIDTLEMFLLRGPAEHIDRALAAAAFGSLPVPGMRVTQPPLEAFEPGALEDIVSAEDRWDNVDGQTLRRLYVRGETSGGQHVLHVWAFTT